MLQRSFAAVCCYFNPCRYRSRLRNYRAFRAGIDAAGVHLLTVELAFGHLPFELSDFDEVLQLRTRDVMWQKERLLNVGIGRLLDEGCEKIAWLDADIVFEDAAWATAVCRKLDSVPICQVFGRVHRIYSADHPGKYRLGSAKYFARTGILTHWPGFPGYAWAARADLLKCVRLYDAAVTGGGDLLIWFANFCRAPSSAFATESAWLQAIASSPVMQAQSRAARRHYVAWARQWGARVRGNVGFVDQSIRALYHGRERYRMYGDRYELLKAHAFDPGKDLRLDPALCWQWASEKPQLQSAVHQYFEARREDD